MKNKYFIRTLSLILSILMITSVTSILVVNAEVHVVPDEFINYTIEVSTAGSSGCTDDTVGIKLNGTEGSTYWITSSQCNTYGTHTLTPMDIDIGELESVTLKVEGSDKWYPNYIKVTSETGINQTIYCGNWVGENEVTFSKDETVVKFDIKTGDIDGAGTNNYNVVQFVDASGKKSPRINLTEIHPDKNAFERGDLSSFYINCGKGFGRVQYTNIYSSVYSPGGHPWYIDWFTVYQVQGNNKYDQFTIDANQWISNQLEMTYGRLPGKTGAFNITIKTQDCMWAGTDANIELTIVGENGVKTEKCEIVDVVEYYNPGNNFERGSEEVFNFGFKLDDIRGLGEIQGIEISTDKRNNKTFETVPNDDWYVEYIEITEIMPEDTHVPQHVRIDINEKIEGRSSDVYFEVTKRYS